jgi:anthranilate phosphoribosyltransferase
MIKTLIQKLADKKNLSFEESRGVIDFFAEEKATDGQIGAFLTALKLKGETPEEITGFASRMRELAAKVDVSEFENIVDSCGTGGDCSNTFNISTASALLACSSGLAVAKHSNFGFTSKCGSSNVVEALGLNLSKTPEEALKALKENNIAFLHAPYFHKCTASVNPVRKELGIRTVFNFLGPLTNPACPTGQVLGVAVPELCSKMAETLKNLGCKKALVVNGQNPVIDEISLCGKTLVYRLENGVIDNFYLHPSDFGIKEAKLEELAGDAPEVNARIIKDIFSGKITDSRLNAVIINTAGLLWTGNKANSIEEGIKLAFELIENSKLNF